MKKAVQVLSAFEQFLESIPLDRYREELMPIKTVEQDLPPDLNPLPAIYAAFWVEQPVQFPEYDAFFDKWWKEHLLPLDAFIRRYFWGCSHEFVFLGFKARLYRTLISVLTQFHFGYLWRAHCKLPMEASAELDMKGIDGLVYCDTVRVALQVKKETYRPEARGPGRFAARRREADWIVEVPYTVATEQELREKASKAKKQETRERYESLAFLAGRLQRQLANGFVVFRPQYPLGVEGLIREQVTQGESQDIHWDQTLKRLHQMAGLEVL